MLPSDKNSLHFARQMVLILVTMNRILPTTPTYFNLLMTSILARMNTFVEIIRLNNHQTPPVSLTISEMLASSCPCADRKTRSEDV
jgi:hypothetical protein